MNENLTSRLLALPDLEPPADAWSRIVARHARERWRSWRPLLAAAGIVAAAVVAWVLAAGPVAPPPAPITARAQMAGAVEPEVHALRRQSQDMERILKQLPPRTRVFRADTAGLIAELQDRIAVVDDQLNQAAIEAPPGTSGHAVRSRTPQAEEVQDLWRRRVHYMDQLVRARYAEASADGY